MATLKEIAKEYEDEIMGGIAWVAIWKTGRSWNAKAFWLNFETDMIEDEDMKEAQEIVKADANAIFVNEYYTAHMGEGTLEDIMEGIRFHYEKGFNLLSDSTAYSGAYISDDEPEGDQGQKGEAMKLNKDQFLKTEVGSSMLECIAAWDRALTGQNRYAWDSREGKRERRAAEWCQAQWEVYKMVLIQFYGIEYNFTRTDEYFGICTEDETDWLMKVDRQEGSKHE